MIRKITAILTLAVGVCLCSQLHAQPPARNPWNDPVRERKWDSPPIKQLIEREQPSQDGMPRIPHSPIRNPQSEIRNRLVVVVANRVCLADLDSPALPTISKMLRKGAVGLVSPNCIGGKSDYSVMLTASAGASCRGDSYVRESYDEGEMVGGETARDAYRLRTGYPAGSGCAVFLGLGQAQHEAEDEGLSITSGACGQALHVSGKVTSAVGNADRPPEWIDRSAAVLAMDSRGLVDVGLLTNWSNNPSIVTVPDRSRPLGPAEILLDRTFLALQWADYVVVYYGDTVRLDEQKISIADEAFELHRVKALQELDSLLSRLMSAPEARGTTFMLISFSPPSDGLWDQLTPVVIYPSDKPGLLTSATTRTPGLIAASDFAPTVLKLMRVRPVTPIVGRFASTVLSSGSLKPLYDMEARVAANKLLISPITWVFAIMGAAALAGAAIVTGFALKVSERMLSLIRGGLLAGACAPVAMLLAVLAPAGVLGYSVGTALSLVLVAGISLALAAIVARRRSVSGMPILVAFALTCAVLLIDQITGGRLCSYALPSSYQLSGMRYYGIGNEYAGALIGMAAVAAIFLAGSRAARLRSALVVGIATVLLLGLGFLGANYGATVAAVVTFGLVYVGLTRAGFGILHVILSAAVGVILVAALGLLDLAVFGSHGTHAGRATGLAETLGYGYILSLVSRKTLLNFSILASFSAQKAYLAFAPFVALYLFKVRGKISEAYASEPGLIAALKGILVGALFALLLNDSGLVIAGIMLAMTSVFVLYSLLDKKPCQES